MLFWNLLLLSLACIVSPKPLGFPQGCPQKAILSPCTCTYDALFESSLSCNERVESADQLKQIFLNSSGGYFREVKIENVSLESIPAEAFETSEVQSLFVNSSSLTQLFDRPPKVEYLLHALMLTSLEIQSGLDFKHLKDIKSLKTLALNDVYVPLIGDDFRDHVSAELTFVAFENTGTQVISPGAFSRLSTLRTLTIADARVTALTRNILPNPSQVENIFLNYNKLTSLPNDIFSGMPNLKVLSLVGNEFSALDEATFAPVWNTLKYVGIDVNPIHCGCGLRWLVSTNDEKKVRGICASPSGFLGKDLQSLVTEDFEYCEAAATESQDTLIT